MNTLATCMARFTRAWMPVFTLILLGASPSIFAATAPLAPITDAYVHVGAHVTLASPANNAAPVPISLTAKATDDINLHFIYNESGHWVGKYIPNGTLLQKTAYLGDLPVAVLR